MDCIIPRRGSTKAKFEVEAYVRSSGMGLLYFVVVVFTSEAL